MKIYLASSWKTDTKRVIEDLRFFRHHVYDFKNPYGYSGFSWNEIDTRWQDWNPVQYVDALNNQNAERGFGFDIGALTACDACILLLPCGKSAHLELGFAAGMGKFTYVLMFEKDTPELMYKMCTKIITSYADFENTFRT